jgi:N6-L-threonylcarbamoyladenine synthase
MIILGIETTCDETAAAVVSRGEDGRGHILSNVVLSQIGEHAQFGGVVPEIAARAHVEALDRIIAKAMADAQISFEALDGVAAAAGPGLIGGVIVGLTTAKAIAMARDKPLLAVNHLEAHALTARLTDATPFPYCLFLASGGHTQILGVRGVGDYVRLGGTVDDAIGEAFDKTAKLLGLGYPGGPLVEKEAARGDPERFALPRPMLGRRDADFSLSGLSDPQGAAPGGVRNRHRTRRAAACFVHGQCRDDRLGGRGTPWARPDRPARFRASRPLAARQGDERRSGEDRGVIE